jgi:uncharacterized protein YndB with AHSA1/START domain
MPLEPIVHVYELRCGVESAFDTYVERIGEWWDPAYTVNAATLKTVTIEPHVGGRVFATHLDEGDFEWGRVTLWEPPHRLVYTSWLAQIPEHASEISIELAPTDLGCSFRFEHGGWTAANADDRAKFSEWPRILARFIALANGSESRVDDE